MSDGTELVLSARELAAVLKVSTWTIYEGMRRGEIDFVMVGRNKRIPRRWLDELLAGAVREQVAS